MNQEGYNEGLGSEEQNEQYEQWMAEHPEIEIPMEDRRECRLEVAQFEEMVVSFEATYPLEELNLIIDLTPEEAPNHAVREPARLALMPIVEMLNILKSETNITPQQHEELKTRYRVLSRAVGMINNNKVDHTR